MKGRVVGFRMFDSGPVIEIKIIKSESGDNLPINELVEVKSTKEKVIE